jgi:hypothetical protein
MVSYYKIKQCDTIKQHRASPSLHRPCVAVLVLVAFRLSLSL